MSDHEHDIPHKPGESKRSLLWRILRTGAIVLGVIVGFVLVLSLLFLLALQTNRGGTLLADVLLRIAVPYPDANTEFDELRGNFITRIELRGLRMYRLDTTYVVTTPLDAPPNSPSERRIRQRDLTEPLDTDAIEAMIVDTVYMAAIDTFRLRYHLPSLLRRRVHVRELTLRRPMIFARQDADETWDVLQPFEPDDAEGPAFTFRIDEVNVTNGQLHAFYFPHHLELSPHASRLLPVEFPPGRDSLLRVEQFTLHAREIDLNDDVYAHLDTLHARYATPGVSYWTDLRAGGALRAREIEVTGLEIESLLSSVHAAGRFVFPSDDADEVDFVLRAEPLAFRDVRFFLPVLASDGSGTFHVHATGTSRLVDVDAAGEFSDGSSFGLNGQVSIRTEGPMRYTLDGNVRRLNPAFFTQEEPVAATLINANFSADLAGTDLDRLDGTARADLFESRFAGARADDVRIQADFDAGRANFDARWIAGPGTLTASGFIRPFDDVPAYGVRGTTRRLDVGSLGLIGHRSDVNTTFQVDGFGFEMRTADIDVELSVAPSSINDLPIDGGAATLRLADADMVYGVRLLFQDGHIIADGDANFEDPVRYRVRQGTFANVDLAALLGQPRRSSLSGGFRLAGTGTDPQVMVMEGGLDMGPSSYGTFRLQDGSIRFEMAGGHVGGTAFAGFEEAGRFRLDAMSRPFDDVPTLSLTRGDFTGVQLGRFLDDPDLQTDLSGTATFSLRGFDPAIMTLDGRLTLGASRINEQLIQAGRADVRTRAGTVAVEVDVDVPDGGFDLAGVIEPFRAVPTYRITEAGFRNLNLALITANPALRSSLTGSLRLEGAGYDPSTTTLDGRLDLWASVVVDQWIDSASVATTLHAGVVDVAVAVNVPDGATRVLATIEPFLDEPAYDVHEGVFAGINVGALAGTPEWYTDLNGRLQLTGRGFDPSTMQAEGVLALDRSQINAVEVDSGLVALSMEQGLVGVDARVEYDAGRVVLRAAGRPFIDLPDYHASGVIVNLNLADLIEDDTLRARISASFDVEGVGTKPETMRLHARLGARETIFEDLVVDTLRAVLEMDRGVLRVDDLTFRSSVADGSGAGVVALFDTTAASDFRFVADVRDVSPLRRFVTAELLYLSEARIEGRVYGQPGMPRFFATGTASGLIYDELRLARFDGTVAAELTQDFSVAVAEIRGTATSLSVPQLFIERSTFDLAYEPDFIAFDGSVTVDSRRSADLAGHVDLRPDVRQAVVERLDVEMDDDHWELLQVATISFGDEYRVRNLLLFSNSQQVALDGVVDPDGEQNMVLTIEDTRVGPIADLLGYEELDGVVTGSILLTGPAAEPRMVGSIDARIESPRHDVGDLMLALEYEALRLNLDARIVHRDGTTLSAAGYVPMDLRIARPGDELIADQDVSFLVLADSFGVGWIEPFLDPEQVAEFDGRLTGRIEITGTMDDPMLDGAARFARGRLVLPDLGVTYREIDADFTLAQNQVLVQRFSIRSGDGTLSGGGTVDLQRLTLGEFNVNLTASRFLAVDSREYRFVIDGAMLLSGTTELPEIRGRVDVVQGEIFLTEETASPELELVPLTLDDIRTVEERFGIRVADPDVAPFGLYDALAMNLEVFIVRDTWVRSRVNPIMDVQFAGRLDLFKEHFEEIEMFGTIEVIPVRSRIVQFGRRFEVTSGTLTFLGPPDDPQVAFDAAYNVKTLRGARDPDVVITLSVSGRMQERLSLELGSQNPAGLEYTDILSYIATGRPASEGLQLGGAGGRAVLGPAAELLVDQLTAVVEGIAAAGLGLDVVAIEQDGVRGTTVTVGKYVADRLFVALSQPIQHGDDVRPTPGRVEENRPRFTIEYEMTRWLLLRMIQSGSVLRMNFLWEYAY